MGPFFASHQESARPAEKCGVTVPSGSYLGLADAELDVLVSASGRVLLTFQTAEIRAQRISESIARRPDHADVQMKTVFEKIKTRGFESSPSVQVRGLYAVSFPMLDTSATAVAALTIPYAERIDQANRKPLSVIEASLGAASSILSSRIGGHLDVLAQCKHAKGPADASEFEATRLLQEAEPDTGHMHFTATT